MYNGLYVILYINIIEYVIYHNRFYIIIYIYIYIYIYLYCKIIFFIGNEK